MSIKILNQPNVRSYIADSNVDLEAFIQLIFDIQKKLSCDIELDVAFDPDEGVETLLVSVVENYHVDFQAFMEKVLLDADKILPPSLVGMVSFDFTTLK